MTGPRLIVPAARLGVDLAARALPTRADRERYAAEFLAELHGLSPAAQLRHTVGVLSQTFALRAALEASASPGIEEAAVSATIPAGQRFRCRHMHWHHWHAFSTEDGQRYVACSVCRKERAWDSPQPGGWVA
jgi:hypothetical protein